MVAILVAKYHQPLDMAWRFTLREFVMVVNFKQEVTKQSRTGWDDERMGGLEQHLRNMGMSV